MTIFHPSTVRPLIVPKRLNYLAFVMSSKVVKVALLILTACMFSACSTVPNYPAYGDVNIYQPPSGVGTGDIHTLSDGNLVW